MRGLTESETARHRRDPLTMDEAECEGRGEKEEGIVRSEAIDEGGRTAARGEKDNDGGQRGGRRGKQVEKGRGKAGRRRTCYSFASSIQRRSALRSTV